MAKNKVLVVEDAPDFQLIISSALKEEYDVVVAGTAAETFSAVENNDFDLILLDIVLPDKDGYEVCSVLRSQERTQNIPIIFVTSKETVPEKVLGFSLGADDYITKPFNPLELRARVSAKMRSTIAQKESANFLTRGKIEINIPSQRVFVLSENGGSPNKEAIDFTSTEFKLLMYLANHVDHVLHREKILDAVWGGALNVTERTVDTHISKLRKKLSHCGNYIESVHGSGYRFTVKDKAESQAA